MDIVNGYKKLFSPPPALGTVEFVALYSTTDKTKITIEVKNEEVKQEVIKKVTEYLPIKKIILNNQTYNVASQNNKLLIRNAIDEIAPVSFLLSEITFHAGEKFDVGEHGIYEATSSDYAFSLIAEKYGMTTQQLLKLNTWLIDEGRVSFNQNKVLVDVNANFLTNKDHVYQGSSVEDRLIDKNGGFDTYITGNNDNIIDNDNKGRVLFNGKLLSGGEWDENKNAYVGDGGKYTQTSNGWKFVF